MKCIIVEDQVPAQRILKHYLQDFPQWQLLASFTDALQAKEFLQKEEVDLIFLDIHLPRLSGMDFLRNLKKHPAVILTTAFPDYALESYEFKVIDYLMKPIAPERFAQAMDKFHSLHKSAEPEYSFFVKSGYEKIAVSTKELLYIASDMDYTELHLKDKTVLSKETLNYWEQKLGDHGFQRIHKSFLINLEQILEVRSTAVILKNEMEIPIGRAYKDAFRERLES